MVMKGVRIEIETETRAGTEEGTGSEVDMMSEREGIEIEREIENGIGEAQGRKESIEIPSDCLLVIEKEDGTRGT